MNSAVRARLSEKERKQVEAALKNDWKKPMPARRVWLVVGVMLVVVCLALLFPFEVSDKIWQLLVLSITFAVLLADQRNSALIRRLHDIAADALENEGEADATC